MHSDEVRRYVARSVLPAMGIGGRPFTMAPPPESGTRSSLHLMRADGMPPLLLRVFDSRAQAARNAGALRHIEELELPAPRLVFHEGWRSRLTVETWIEGTRHAALADPAAAGAAALEVAGLLARYHRVTRGAYGRPGVTARSRLISFASATQRAAGRMLSSLAANGWLDEAQQVSIRRRFLSWKQAISDISEFSLAHNDANRHNFLVAPAGDVTPVDLHRLAYEPFGEELVNALYHFCRKDAVLGQSFLERYFMVAGDRSRLEFERTRGFFEPLNYLKKMHRRSLSGVGPDDDKMTRWRDRVLAMESMESMGNMESKESPS